MGDLSHLYTEFYSKGLKKNKIETYLKSEQEIRTKTRYYIDSKEVITAERSLEISKNHRAVKNKLHWSLEMTMNEDRSRKHNNNIAEIFFYHIESCSQTIAEKTE